MSISSILSGLLYVEKRKLVQVFPDPVREVWNEWELRVMMLLSMSLQILLIFIGSRRKYTPNNWTRIFLYSSYLMADWVATVAIGVISNQQRNDDCGSQSNNNRNGDNELAAFWAPFLLLHLGGPDTITAYALADNDLWIRHVIGVAVQASVSIYIILMAWQSTWLSFLTIPMLISGIIKYGERSWALRSASRDQFREDVLSDRDQGDSTYGMFMDDLTLKQAEGYHVTVNESIDVYIPPSDMAQLSNDGSIVEKDVLGKAFSLFQTFRRLFVDITLLNIHSLKESQSFFQTHDYKTAFDVIEVELGFVYDVFYTKAPVFYTRWGFFLRFITSSLTILVLAAFSITRGINLQKHKVVDLVITYILLGVAIALEMIALILLLSTDWTGLWLGPESFMSWSSTPFRKVISCLRFRKDKSRWSKSMNQYNLLTFCLNRKPLVSGRFLRWIPMCKWLRKMLNFLREKLENVRQLRYPADITDELQQWIFQQFTQSDPTYITSLPTSRGTLVLGQHGYLDQLKWTMEVDFDHSLLIWHIATNICFNWDGGKKDDDDHTRKGFSMKLADYMLYLLVMCPSMIPIGIGIIRFRDTCAEVDDYLEDKSTNGIVEVCESLRDMTTKVNGKWGASALSEACKLANALQKIENKEKKWEMVCQVWVEMMGYAAGQCLGYSHTEQLQISGELLTHVWLLLAHLGITQQYQLSRGHARTDLVSM